MRRELLAARAIAPREPRVLRSTPRSFVVSSFLSCVVAWGALACSSEALVVGSEHHADGLAAREVSNEGEAPSPAPALAPEPAPGSEDGAGGGAPVDAYPADVRAMVARGKVVSRATIRNAMGWGTSPSSPIDLWVAVDDEGRAIVPPTAADQVLISGGPSPPFPPDPPLGLHSVLQVCNESGRNLYLHSGAGGPFRHGDRAFAPGACVEFLVRRAEAKVGVTYDHLAGSEPSSIIHLRVRTLPARAAGQPGAAR